MAGVERDLVGWDVGGAHVKACLMRAGEVVDVAQWPAALWLGLDRLGAAIDAAARRWPGLAGARHAVTMTGEMVDLFEDRADGVRQIAAALVAALAAGLPGRAAPELHFYAGEQGWCGAAELDRRWPQVASANWLATANHAARVFGDGLLVDIGSTTTDLIRFRHGRADTGSRTDLDRLTSGELAYQGVVRTPLCALARHVDWNGRPVGVMNEFFATTADVYRLTGELDPAHDQSPAADGAARDLHGSRRRIARMIGLDAGDAGHAQWSALARQWRDHQLGAIAAELRRVLAGSTLPAGAVVVSAGCGAFLVDDLLARAGLPGPPPVRAYGQSVAKLSAAPAVAAWAQVCAPAVAVAALRDRELR